MDNPEVDRFGNQIWYNEDGKLHRTDGPAIISANGHQYWYQHDNLYREDGPAQIWPRGDVDWWLNGNMYTFEDWLDIVNISDESKVMLKLKYG
jgi:hypothetical protein